MARAAGDLRSDFLLSCTVDFPDDVANGSFTLDLIDEMMGMIRSMGVRRIYWLYYGDIDPDSYWAGSLYDHSLMQYGRETLDRIGEPLKAAVPLAHKHGMEVYGVLKAYNTGASGSYPEGSDLSDATTLKRIGGTVWQAIPFAQHHPEVRLRRYPVDLHPGLESTPIKKIRLLKRDDSATRVTGEHLQVWVSPNNWQYRPSDTSFTVNEAVVPAARELRDYYGDVITAEGAPVRTLTLEGLDLTDKYILVTTDFTDDVSDFVNTAVGMIEAYGDAPEPLPIEVATLSTVWNRPRDFRQGGLEFDSGFGVLQVALDSDNRRDEDAERWSSLQRGGVIAFARGRNDHLPSTPCEMYPEVRKLWSGWVDRILDTGVDGLDLRVSHHGSLVDAPEEYGYNEPVVQEFERRFGTEPTLSAEDRARLAAIRGEHYTDFVRETAAKVRGAGRKMQFHLHTEAFRDNPVHGQLMGFPPNMHFDWKTWVSEGLADGITFRTSWFEAWEDPPEGEPHRQRLGNSLGEPVAKDAIAFANGAGVPLYLNRYLARAVGIEEYLADLQAAYNDNRFSGFDLYEWVSLARATPDASGINPIEDWIGRIRTKAQELGLV